MPKFFIISILSLILLFNVNFTVQAAGLVPTSSPCANLDLPDGTNCGNYGLNDFIKIAANVAVFLESIIGALALLMFVYGGVLMIISGGSSEKVTKARGILVGAVIGLAIFFASYLIIGFLLAKLGVITENQVGTWATTDFATSWTSGK